MSGGPIIWFSVDGHAIGDPVRLSGNGGMVEVEAWAESIFPIHTLEIVQQGRVVSATADRTGAPTGVEDEDQSGRPHLAGRACERPRLYQPDPASRCLEAWGDGTHLADLRGLRRRLVALRPGDGAVHAHIDRRQSDLHPRVEPTGSTGDGNPPPRRGGP